MSAEIVVRKDSTPTEIKSISEKVIYAHGAVERAAGELVQNAVIAGNYLIDLKEKLPRGTYISYVEKNFPFTRQTASNYTRIARAFDQDELQMENALSIRGALKQIAAPKKEDRPEATAPGPLPKAPSGPYPTPVGSISFPAATGDASAEAEAKQYITAFLADDRIGEESGGDIQALFEERLPADVDVDGEVRGDLADAYEPYLEAISTIQNFIYDRIAWDDRGMTTIEAELAMIIPLLDLDNLDSVAARWVVHLEETADTATRLWKQMEGRS